MGGLTSVAPAAIFMRGHALMRNIRGRFYRVLQSGHQRLIFAWSWNRVADAVHSAATEPVRPPHQCVSPARVGCLRQLSRASCSQLA